MTTTAIAIAESDVLRHISTLPPFSQQLVVEWLAGTQYSATIGQRITNLGGIGEELFAEVIRHVTTYLRGPEGENFSEWKKLFGSTQAFVPITEMTLGWVTLPNRPHLLCLWSNSYSPVLRITSSEYPILQELYRRIQAEAATAGLDVVPCAFGTRGLLVKFSK